jgi:hypothetical protein
MKPGDAFQVSPEICGRMTARVCLMETLAVGAAPFALMALTCNEREPTGAALLSGIQAEIIDSGFPDIPVGGSTEDNMPTSMTALGITLLGECRQLAWRFAREGDFLYLFGKPYVGEEVIAHFSELPSSRQMHDLRNTPGIGDVIPCGSRSIAWELQVLERETGLLAHLYSGIDAALLRKSAGPATCAIFTSAEPIEISGDLVMRLGSLTRR